MQLLFSTKDNNGILYFLGKNVHLVYIKNHIFNVVTNWKTTHFIKSSIKVYHLNIVNSKHKLKFKLLCYIH